MAKILGFFIIGTHSFFLTIFRYTCLFHENFLLRFNLTPNVSIIITSKHNKSSSDFLKRPQIFKKKCLLNVTLAHNLFKIF